MYHIVSQDVSKGAKRGKSGVFGFALKWEDEESTDFDK